MGCSFQFWNWSMRWNWLFLISPCTNFNLENLEFDLSFREWHVLYWSGASTPILVCGLSLYGQGIEIFKFSKYCFDKLTLFSKKNLFWLFKMCNLATYQKYLILFCSVYEIYWFHFTWLRWFKCTVRPYLNY